MRALQLVALVALIATVNCGGGSDSTTPPAKTVSRVAVTGASTTLNVGQAAIFTASAFEASGAPITSPGTTTWSSSATTVAGVDQTGKVTAVGGGSATIAADIAGVKGSLIMRVNKDTIFTPGIAFSPNTLTVPVGATVIFMLGFDGIGHDVLFATKTGSPAYIPVSVKKAVPVTFPSAGNFPYSCPTHPEMTGVISVQ